MSIDTGAFLRGLTKGLFAAQEMRTQREEREERKSQLALLTERWKTDYVDRAANILEAITDPADWERHVSRFDERGSVLGFEPGEVRRLIGPFSEERRNRARQKAASERVAILKRTYEGRFWTPEVQSLQDTFEGRLIPISDLVSISGELATREVKRPIVEERPAPEITGTGPGLERAGLPQRVKIGEEIVREPVLPIPAQPLTFDMLYEKAKGTPWEGRPITLKDGVPDLRLATQIAKDNGWIVTNEDQFRTRERYQRFLREKLVASVRDPSAGINRGELRKQMEQAGMNWAAEMDKAKQEIAIAAASLAQKLRAGEGDGGGVPATISVFGDWEVLPPLTKSGESRYRNRRTNQVLGRSGATDVLKRTRDPNLAAALGVTAPAVEEPTEKVEGREMTLAQIEDEMRLIGAEIKTATLPSKAREFSLRLKQLTAARTRLLRRTGRRPEAPSQTIPIPPAIPGQQAVPEGAPTATNPQTGQRIYWDGKQWVPVP